MEIRTSLFGAQLIDPETVITFPQGIPGFEDKTIYKLFKEEENEIIFWLQSVDDADLGFSVADPAEFNINYLFTLTDEEEQLLQLNDVNDLAFLLILQKNENSGDKPMIKGTLTSPLVINTKTRLAIQKIIPRIEQSITLIEQSPEIQVTEA
ncbi:MAG: flagellar assembly protein FliW [Methylovulum sp.]|jgi:flagellar assembly factor FliW|nr:flagellar assembly protein FliW [Methylovulum sp.]MCF7998619.1 flagellar assembly protein FliW [Methylovulum sp.]MCF8006331.1 flagellar assembly protein FliW [Methylovulum sp.]